MKARLLKLYAEVYELERGGWLCKTKRGAWCVLNAAGEAVSV